MTLPRMRTAPEAIKEIQALDPKSGLTLNALRRMMKTGEIPVVYVNTKRQARRSTAKYAALVKAVEYLNSKPTNTYSLVLSHFRKGKENGIHLQELEKITELDNRALRKIIEAIRRNGVCVCSDENGYYFPANADELERYIKRVSKTARSTFFTLQTARNELEKIQINKQLCLFSKDGVFYE